MVVESGDEVGSVRRTNGVGSSGQAGDALWICQVQVQLYLCQLRVLRGMLANALEYVDVQSWSHSMRRNGAHKTEGWVRVLKGFCETSHDAATRSSFLTL